MKKRCLSLLLTLCLLAALAVPAFAQEAEKQPTLQPASEHPSVLLNTPAVEIPAVRAEIEPMCVPHASMRSLSIARGYEGYLYYSLYRGTYSGTAASGSARMLNSAAGVQFPWARPPPIRLMPAMFAFSSG